MKTEKTPHGNPERLILFTRRPEPGRTKTRLIPLLGQEGAAAFQRQMTEHTLSMARRYIRTHACDLEIRFEGGTPEQMARWLGEDLLLAPQKDGHLGERMGNALESAFHCGVQRAVLAGTDIPGITAGTFESAFAALTVHHTVFGPARDGGYYLVGMQRSVSRRAIPLIFEDIPWGTGIVLEKTLDRLTSLGLSAALTEVLRDVDRPEDLAEEKMDFSEAAKKDGRRPLR